MSGNNSAPTAVPFTQALRFWLRLGFISFGGPAGQIAIMHRELVQEKRWVSERRFLHALNYCMLLPGPEAQQLATYLGWLMHRTWGGVLAGALFVLPSLFILIGLSWLYMAFGHLPLVAALLYGIKPAVAAIVLHAVWRIGGRTLKSPSQTPWLWAISLLSFLALAAFNVPFPWVVGVAALVGWLGSRFAPLQFAPGSAGDGGVGGTKQAALIDDHTPTPAHAIFARARLAKVLMVGALLWLLPMVALLWTYGWGATLAHMGWFFSKAALLTFGGAYAVLPYVHQGAVEHFQWLSAAQMMDGLALGETTPGPLIIVVAFVGFVGGWTQQVLGPDAIFLGAALAACVATWFTFLPSFIFILAGGPLVESTHGKLGFTAPLTAITAAVVGVIASLGLFFLGHVLFVGVSPRGLAFVEAIDGFALALVVACFLALVRYKRGVISVIVFAAVAGCLRLLIVRGV